MKSRLFIDSDVVIDFFTDREPFAGPASELFELNEQGAIQLYLSAISINNIYYIVRRYFICECKDWEKPVDFTTMSKLCRILSSTKIKFGILFAKNGISGEGKLLYAEREQRKVFQDSDIIFRIVT